MIPSDDVLAGLPAPLDDEPPSVRQDIADELADHLACAYRRELLKVADESTAEQRVLNCFGNPHHIAYRLWFQALWGRIMLHRFTRVVQGLKIAGGLAALLLVLRMSEQQVTLHRQMATMSAGYESMRLQAEKTQSLLEKLLQDESQADKEASSNQLTPAIHIASGVMLPDDVLLNFTAPWCGPCQQMNPIIEKLREQGYAVRDVDVDRERAIAEHFGITAIPTFVRLVNRQEVLRQTGAASSTKLLEMAQLRR